MPSDVAAIVIGRNEGERLARCLASLKDQADPILYVDSGSTDGSIAAAQAVGAKVVELDLSIPFTAARARNAGFEKLIEIQKGVCFVQFVDGDCELLPGWIRTAVAALETQPNLAVVCGRRREKDPDASLWNELIDEEWNTPVGDAKACGGDAMIRVAALAEVGGYRSDLIAGEEPEMCFRLRQKGWRIRRLDAEMTLHDAAMTRFGQWWRRCKRGGHAFAEVSSLHKGHGERLWVKETRSALLWGAAVPSVAVLGAFFSPWALFVLMIYPAQVLRLRRRGMRVKQAVFLVLSKFPEAQGAIGYFADQVLGRRRALIEYK